MSLPNQPPEGGARSRMHWPYCATKKGEQWHAYLWGPIHWYDCHKASRTKPCLHSLTSGRLNCSHCDNGFRPESVGYVPLVRELDGRPVMVIVGVEAIDTLAEAKWKQRVVVGRGENATDRVYVCIAPIPKTWQTTLKELQTRADLTRTLLAVWNVPALTEWYLASPHAAGEPATVPTSTSSSAKPRVPVGEEWERMAADAPPELVERARLQRAAKAEQEVEMGLPIPSLNGRHKK